MRTLLDFLYRYGHLLLFLLLEAVSGVLLYAHHTYHRSLVMTATYDVTARVNAFWSGLVSFIHLGETNRELLAENARLQIEANALREQLESQVHNAVFPDSIVYTALEGIGQIPARVVGNMGHPAGGFLVIDKGTSNGVEKGMGVVGQGGVVGVVDEVGKNYSLVMPIPHPLSNISCSIRSSGYFGYLQWSTGNGIEATLSDVPRYARVAIGDTIETSGRSHIFPGGLMVGTVEEIANSDDGQFYSLTIRLSTDFPRLREVLLLRTPQKSEVEALLP